ncbi:hypothetical protein BHF71_03960 [Vulcanibacillus modesticaldus]|uniref:Chorismate dehydratase n=1 Tax=Vulcanibacillus modesticaldus TaxID=337097 RepID=A0A1D2YSL3_9BACI|nr:menaquinone biosynthesis protein [Vulcanibacillus modesticaldus]OEF97298.1 hypothetical protein BHF71_03960 [Vulcanibacillus modesticaldus]
MGKLRLGRISYTNIWPITYFFDEDKFKNEVDFIPQVPSQLNRKMSEGKIDIGAISSFAYADQAGKYVLLPNLSVSSYGTVGSISLFLKTDLNDVANKKIALTNTSDTSVNLLKIILEKHIGGKPKYIRMAPQLDKMMEVADAALLIGDEALLAGKENERTKQYQVIDLGCEWLKRTNHWMTFAVYAVRREVLSQSPELLYKIYNELINSKKVGSEKLNLIINESISRFGGSYDFWNQYFSGLSYDFSTEQIEGLKYYYKMAVQIGVLEKEPEIEVVDFDKLMLQFTNR